jgi:ABC-type antimicrobial peptide transport system permease subunit
VAALARDCADASAIGLVVRTRAQVAHAGRNWAPGAVQGCDLGFLDVRGFLCAEGERFTDDDIAEAAQVCLLGRTVVENLFGDESPVGALVRVRGAPFRVVGVLEPKGANTWGADQDDVVLMPWTTVKKKLEGSAFEAVDYVFASARTTEAVAPLEDEIRAVLRERHRCATDEETGEPQDDFTIRDLTEAMRAMTATTRIMAALLAAVAAVSLLAGGAGIANIMVVSVAERTREIGLRMALGARARDVLAQFLLEAVALAGLGGAGGAVVGALGAVAASRIAAIPVVVSPGVVAAAVALSGAIGALAGIAPAWRASRLDPIAALRAE